MSKLSLTSYIWKCVAGSEVVYVLCVLGGFLPIRTAGGTELHATLLETMPGFQWGSFGGFVWGAVLVGILSAVFGSYMVWMYNTSLVK